jgi:hypothetical protein
MPDITKRTSQYIDNLSFDETYQEATVLPVLVSNGTLIRQIAEGIQIPKFDYVARGWNAGTFTETWTFKIGGSGGTTVATVTIVYDDVNMSNIVTVTKT